MNASIRIAPGPGQESVWDYPRPPRIEPLKRRVRVLFGGQTVAESVRAVRVLETSSPPTIYVPPDDVRMDAIRPAADDRQTWCEWKGRASYVDVAVGARVAERAGWSYPNPRKDFEPIAGWLSFYPGRVDACYLDDERVRPQNGRFYGGWITDDIVGPFKGDPGTEGW